MATRSAEFLEVEEYGAPNLPRSRSGGYVDFLKEQSKWERRDREQAMKRYHDSQYPDSRQTSDLLHVPTFDTAGNRRVRSHDEITERKEKLVSNYSLREQKPSYDISDGAPLPTRLPIRKTQSGKPSIKVVIHQDDIPSSAPMKTTPKKSPGVSPRSPTVQPQLQFQFTILQNKLAEITDICAPNLHIEAANPHDLTFTKIAEEVKGFAFQLRVWNHVANLDSLVMIDKKKRKMVEFVAHTLDRLLRRVTDLSDACAKARPKDLKIGAIPEADDDKEYESYDEDEGDEESNKDVTDSWGFIIQSHLNSIRLMLQTLGRTTRTLQEASPDARTEVDAVEGLVEEVDKFFGSEDALDRYRIDLRFAGRKALDEARDGIRVRR